MSANLMDRGRFRHLGSVVFVNTEADLSAAAAESSLVLADLSVVGALQAVSKLVGSRGESNPLKVIAYVGHVEKELINAASEMPGVEVYPRSVFFRRLANTSL